MGKLAKLAVLEAEIASGMKALDGCRAKRSCQQITLVCTLGHCWEAKNRCFNRPPAHMQPRRLTMHTLNHEQLKATTLAGGVTGITLRAAIAAQHWLERMPGRRQPMVAGRPRTGTGRRPQLHRGVCANRRHRDRDQSAARSAPIPMNFHTKSVANPCDTYGFSYQYRSIGLFGLAAARAM